MEVNPQQPQQQPPAPQPMKKPEIDTPAVPNRNLPDVQASGGFSPDSPDDNDVETENDPEIPERKNQPDKIAPPSPKQNNNKHMRGLDEGNVEGP